MGMRCMKSQRWQWCHKLTNHNHYQIRSDFLNVCAFFFFFFTKIYFCFWFLKILIQVETVTNDWGEVFYSFLHTSEINRNDIIRRRRTNGITQQCNVVHFKQTRCHTEQSAVYYWRWSSFVLFLLFLFRFLFKQCGEAYTKDKKKGNKDLNNLLERLWRHAVRLNQTGNCERLCLQYKSIFPSQH